MQLNEEKSAELNYKTVFLSKVAHEFKNPLICISELVNEIFNNFNNENTFKNQNSNIILTNYTLTDLDLNSIKQIKTMSDYLLLLIKDLDYFSHQQIKKQGPALEIGEVNFVEVTELSKNIADNLLNKFNKIRLKFVIENKIKYIFKLVKDSLKLKHIVINLISNAIKFTNQGFVKLIISLDFINNLEFKIEDTGIELSSEQIFNIYTPFKKGSGNDNNKFGTGLGLYIVIQMLTLLGTKLEIQSKIGEGSSFSFSLVLTDIKLDANDVDVDANVVDANNVNEANKADFVDEEIFQNKTIELENNNHTALDIYRNNIYKKKKKHNFSTKSISASTKKSSFTESLTVRESFNLIVVDDERISRLRTIRILKRNADKLNKKIEIIEAKDGVECLNLAYTSIKKGVNIYGIISNEMMSHLNGTTTAEMLKQIKNLNTQTIPFYLLTALPEVTNQYIDGMISKPLCDGDSINFLKKCNL